MSSNVPTKPANRSIPRLVRYSFIALEIAVLALQAANNILNRHSAHRIFADLSFWFAFTLLASTVILYFRDPRLADSGIITIVLWFLIAGLGPAQL